MSKSSAGRHSKDHVYSDDVPRIELLRGARAEPVYDARRPFHSLAHTQADIVTKNRARIRVGVPGVFPRRVLETVNKSTLDEPISEAYRAAPHVKLTPVVKRTLFLFTFSPVIKLTGRVKK